MPSARVGSRSGGGTCFGRCARWFPILLTLAWAGGTGRAPSAQATEAETQREPTVTIVFAQGRLADVVRAFTETAGIEIALEGEIAERRIDLIVRDRPVSEVLDRIAKANGLAWWKKEDGSFVLATRESYEKTILPGLAVQRVFHPAHIAVEDFEKAVSGFLTPKIGTLRVDPDANKATLTDLPPVVERIEFVLRELDIPEDKPSPPDPKLTMVFANAKIEAVALSIQQQTGIEVWVEGQAAERRIDIVARDLSPHEVLDTIAATTGLVWWKRADGTYGLADKAYYEKRIVPELSVLRAFRPTRFEVAAFETAVSSVLTPSVGQVVVDPRTNKVVVFDLPSVVETVARLLHELDAPETWRSPAAGASDESESKITLSIPRIRIEAAAMALSRQSGRPISVEGAIAGTLVEIEVEGLTLPEVLDRLATPNDWVWWEKANGRGYGLADRAYYEGKVLPGSVGLRVFRPNGIAAERFAKAVEEILTPTLGEIVFVDDRTNKVLVRDLPSVFETIERLIREIDL